MDTDATVLSEIIVLLLTPLVRVVILAFITDRWRAERGIETDTRGAAPVGPQGDLYRTKGNLIVRCGGRLFCHRNTSHRMDRGSPPRRVFKNRANDAEKETDREHSSLFPTFIMSDSFHSFGLSQVVVPSSRMPVGRNLAPIPHPGVSYVRGEPGVPRIRSVRATMHACVLRWSQTAVVDPRCVLKPKHKKGGGDNIQSRNPF